MKRIRTSQNKNIDETYVIAYEHSPLAEQNDENEDQVNWFRYIVTTKRLLRNASSSNLIHTDATQKIVVQRFPLLVFGTTDKTPDQKFHLIAIMITKTETADDFALGFKSIRSAMLFIANVNYSPRYCMADACTSIVSFVTNAAARSATTSALVKLRVYDEMSNQFKIDINEKTVWHEHVQQFKNAEIPKTQV